MKIQLNGSIIELVKNENNKYGIEQLKEVAKAVLNEWKLIHGRLKDGKLSWLESVMTGAELISIGKDIISELQDLRNELQDLTELEIEELILHISKISGLSDVKAGIFIEKVFIETIDIILSVLNIFRTAKEVF